MAIEPGSVDHLTQVISQVIGPSFLLGAVAAFISILIGRLNGIIERLRSLNALADGDRLKADIPRLERRVKIVNLAVHLAIFSGIVAALLILVTFALAFLGFQHVWLAAILFMISLGLLCGALLVFAREIQIGVNDHDRY